MDSWERFDKKLLQNKKDNLNMEDITDVDYKHAKRVFKNFNNTNLGDYHDLCVQSDTLLLEDAFENFRNKCIEIYELDTDHFLSVPGLAWQAYLKETRKKIGQILSTTTIMNMWRLWQYQCALHGANLRLPQCS